MFDWGASVLCGEGDRKRDSGKQALAVFGQLDAEWGRERQRASPPHPADARSPNRKPYGVAHSSWESARFSISSLTLALGYGEERQKRETTPQKTLVPIPQAEAS